MKRVRPFIRLRNALIHGFTYLLMALVRALPEQPAYRMGRGLALFAWAVMPNWRHNCVRGLTIFYAGQHPDNYVPPTEPFTPETPVDPAGLREYRRIARQSAINLGYHVVEFMRMSFIPMEQVLGMVVEEDGVENFAHALAQGHGAIGMSIHFGNWEVCGAILTKHVPLYAVGKEQRDDFFTKLAFPWRARFGINNIFSGDKMSSAILRALKGNGVLGLLGDQNGGKTGTFVPFAGTPASTVRGPAVLTMRTGAPLVLTYCRRLAPGKHRFVVGPPLSLDGVPGFDPVTRRYTDESIVEVLNRMNKTYEAVIRSDPTQWLWGHKRWKTRPPGQPWLY